MVELRLQDVGYTTIQNRYNIGSSTVTLIMKRYRELGIPLETLYGMSPKSVELAFYPPENLKRSTKPMPDFVQIHARMLSMKTPNLGFLWLEYKEKNPDGYQLSQFYEMYRAFVAENYGQTSVTMPVERIPGERMYIDWVGDQPELLLDTSTGELKKVHIFATTLGFSSCVYAEAFLNEKLASFITGVVHALSFYGAVPKYLVPDNLRAAVTKHTKDELVLNSVFSDLEDFYDTVVLPPPPRKPKGKPTVENHVRYLETHLIEKLREKAPFSSIEALNAETERIISDINQRNFKNQRDIRKSRQHAFETYDKPQMKSLPAGHFTICDYKYFLRVPENYHLEYDGHYYSVMYTMHGKPALLKANLDDGKASGAVTTFNDVSAGDWYADSVSWAVENGVAQGKGESFGANDAVTREQLAVMLYNYAGKKGYDVTVKGDISRFADNDSASPWASDALAWAVGVGIINGARDAAGNTILDPRGNASRAQVTAMTQRFCEKAAK